MPSIPNRIRKLEEQLEASAQHALSVQHMTDAELMETILESRGIAGSPEGLPAHLEHFNATGELPEPSKE